ncbi:MAG: lactonase family protein [Anaerolineae bacterium]|jgi:6-phosphogluconolactonase|nr:lactonase family protein [Chloroflexota bacterium]
MQYRLLLAQQDDDLLTMYAMDGDTGRLTVEQRYPVAGGPAPLALDPQGRWIAVGLRASPALATVSLDGRGLLGDELSRVAVPTDACYVSIDKTGQNVLAAYYQAGTASVHRLDSQGRIAAEATQWLTVERHAHCLHTDRSNRFAFLPQTMPADRINQYRFDAQAGQLTPNLPALAPVAGGQGPRHYAYHPALNRLYTSNEDGSSTSAYALGEDGTLQLLGTWSTLPEGFAGRNTCAQIHLDPQGRWLFVSNRGHNSLAIFAVDPVSGMLTPQGHRPTEPTPRVFGVDPSGRFVYAAGLGSNRLAAYRLDGDTGSLQEIETYAVGRNPMWVLFIAVPEGC